MISQVAIVALLASTALAQTVPPPKESGQAPPPAGPAAALRESLASQQAAAQVQREAARKQADLLRLEPLRPTVVQPAGFDCDPISEVEVNPMIEAATKSNRLQTGLVRAVIRQESQFYPCAVSDRGAEGLMQLMPSTIRQFGVNDAFDPKQSIDAGAAYLKQLFEKYAGQLELVLGAYNAGQAAVDEAKGIPDIPETRSYVDAIMESLGKKPPGTESPDKAPPDQAPPDKASPDKEPPANEQ